MPGAAADRKVRLPGRLRMGCGDAAPGEAQDGYLDIKCLSTLATTSPDPNPPP